MTKPVDNDTIRVLAIEDAATTWADEPLESWRHRCPWMVPPAPARWLHDWFRVRRASPAELCIYRYWYCASLRRGILALRDGHDVEPRMRFQSDPESIIYRGRVRGRKAMESWNRYRQRR